MRLREALRFPALLECEELRQEFSHAKSSCGFRVSGFGLPKQPAMNTQGCDWGSGRGLRCSHNTLC